MTEIPKPAVSLPSCTAGIMLIKTEAGVVIDRLLIIIEEYRLSFYEENNCCQG